MSWRQRILAYAKGLGRDVYEHELGIGIDFEDGCDAFWVLPGEVMSTLPIPADGPASVDVLLERYVSIGRLRERSLHVVRHYLASKGIRIDRRRSGSWSIELESGISSVISVGAHLTRVTRDTGDVYECVRATIEGTLIRKAPSRMRIDRYLRAEGAPPNERSIDSKPSHATLIPPTITAMLRMMGVCRAVGSIDEESTSESIAATAKHTGRIAQTLLRLAERLPDAEASVDLLKPRILSLSFQDEYMGQFEINVRSRDLGSRIRADGPIVVGDQLADEYLRLRKERARALAAIRQAATVRGWKQMIGRPLPGSSDYLVFLGQSQREVTFQPDKLTALLATSSLADALRGSLDLNPGFADECVAALDHAKPKFATIVLPNAKLAPKKIPPVVPLVELDELVIAGMDAFAADSLVAYMANKQTRALWEYRNRNVYDPGIDTWASMGDWVALAHRRVNGEWPDPTAILILLDAGDPRGEELARSWLLRATPSHESGDAEVEIAWRYRHAYPEIARTWFDPQPGDDVPCSKYRAKLGDPVARRYVSFSKEMTDDADDVASVASDPRTAANEQKYQELLLWARTEYRWSPPQTKQLVLALKAGWSDVAERLADNPYLLAGLLTHDRRHAEFDEPGMLLAGEFLLVWSRLSPSRFLARLLATACRTDLVTLATAATEAAAIRKPKIASAIPMVRSVYPAWLEQLKPQMAIAWTRCRTRLHA